MLSTMQDTPLSITQLLRHGSSVHGTSEVVTWTGTGPRRSSYAQVGDRAAQLAHALRTLGVRGDERVATFMWNNAEHLELYLAVPAMGAVLHTLNIRLSPDQLVFAANHAEDHVIVVDATLAPVLGKQLPRMRTVRHVIVANGPEEELQAPEHVKVHSYEQLLAEQPAGFDWPETDERSAAAMCYTSGTTGDPKGVVYSHRSVWLHSMNVCMADGMALAQRDKALTIVPQFHAMSWGLPYASFMTGASLMMPDRFLQPEAVAQMLAAERPTFAAAVPTVWQGLLIHLERAPQDISHLREVVIGGSAAPPSMMHAFEEKYGVAVVHAWGMTETSPVGTIARPPAGVGVRDAWAFRYTQGRFPAAVRARLVREDGQELPWDGASVGEVEVRGPWVTGTYYGAADAEGFHDGWLRTGDVGRITADGFLTLTDRSKDVIKSGGEWISSVELENQVMSHTAVAESAVIAIPDERWGERPLVIVMLKEHASCTAGELRSFLFDRVAKWQLPENWAFVEEIPKTSVGKFDKKSLRATYEGGGLDVRRMA